MSPPASAAVERAARESYGKLVALVARATRDLHAAEDAVSDALARALTAWREQGVPNNPDAWLLIAARRRLLDQQRRRRARRESQHDPASLLAILRDDTAMLVSQGDDPRLGLIWACCHPAIDPIARTPLALQVVLGVETERIASAMLLSPMALKQRLTRVKRKIRDAGISLDTPEPDAICDRLGQVLAAVYAAFGIGWETANDPGPVGLDDEAIQLARVVAELVPDHPEAKGLLSLMLYCEARRPARTDGAGRFVPLSEQDTSLWSYELLHEAEALLHEAASAARLGPYQVEAAIQSGHVHRLRDGDPDAARSVIGLYEVLVTMKPTIGSRIARAAAIGELASPTEGLCALNDVPVERVTNHQPYWAVKGLLSLAAGHTAEASTAVRRAIGLTADPAVREFLTARLAGVR